MPGVTVAPTTLTFDAVPLGSSAPEQDFSITNDTGVDISFALFHASGSATEFPVTGLTGNNPICTGETAIVEVGYAPEAMGTRSATLGFSTPNAELAAITIRLTGSTTDRLFGDGFEAH